MSHPKLRRFATATNKTLGLVLPPLPRFSCVAGEFALWAVSLFSVIFKVLFKAYSARLFPASACPTNRKPPSTLLCALPSTTK